MRITGGQFKGRVIKTLKGRRLRPSSEKVREALFDILGEKVRGSRVLDLFAGSGALGLEALSRGAKLVVFVEKWKPAVKIIARNLADLGLVNRAEIIRADYAAALRKLGKEKRIFDLAIADPPYRYSPGDCRRAKELGEKLLLQFNQFEVLLNGLFILEHFTKSEPPRSYRNWQKMRTEKYGQTSLSFFAKNPNIPGDKP
jgi:16S rRNA (guanine966-N2)-methyltransferase